MSRARKSGEKPRGTEPCPPFLNPYASASPRVRAWAKREAANARESQRRLREAFYARQDKQAA